MAFMVLRRMPWFGAFIGSLFAISCAQVNAPTGGPMDEQPPGLLSSDPPSGQLNVRPSMLSMTFDEFVQLKNTATEMFLSPPLTGVRTLETRVKGRRIDVLFPADAQWQANTTYVLHFGGAVVDLHEGNAADGMMWAFATGTQLDTLSIVGTVRNALDGKPVEKCRVLAFPDSAPVDSIASGVLMPQQVAVANADGSFVFRHLAPGRYRLLSVSDDNRDYQWGPGEAAGLLPNGIEAGDSVVQVILHSPTQPPQREPRVVSSEADSTGLIRMAWDGGSTPSVENAFYRWQVDSLTSKQAGGTFAHLSFSDSLWAWSSQPANLDTILWHWSDETQGFSGWDTLRVRRARPEPSHVPALVNARSFGGKTFPQAMRRFTWSRPLSNLDVSKTTFHRDSVLVSPGEVVWVSPRELAVSLEERADEQWQVLFVPGAVTDFSGQSNQDSLRFTWTTHAADHAGRLLVSLTGLTTPGWLGNVAQADSIYVQGDTTVVWAQMAPGKTSLTFSSDLNSDGDWGQTDPRNWTPAEPRRILQEAIDIRSNWDVEFVVDFNDVP